MSHKTLLDILKSWVFIALGVGIASHIVPGISYDDGLTLLFVVVLLSALNAFIKPIIVLFTLPFIVITLGLGLILINGLLFILVSKMVSGFTVETFWSALFGSIVVSAVSMFANFMIGCFKKKNKQKHRQSKDNDDDIIDI